ncbi:heparin lyase I family protein [Burkholderia ambifaria]|uniref:Polysaccharide lyase-like protein n=1 Tax=Burkholderia ambifaria MEX-5 TaxID=396597 RepID=B1SXA9_9BURK|nr:heparin lyase I family protein [Burkholderia ambifaria]EDT44016.1 conserved hypothetical protein [Burkholderia ambifaria MEX-5]
MKRAAWLSLLSYACTAQAALDCPVDPPFGYTPVMAFDWRDGVPPRSIQAPSSRSITVGSAEPGGPPMLNVRIDRNDNFAHVANGTPRAEIVLNRVTFVNGDDYMLQWSTRLPDDFEIDDAHPEVITQILQLRPPGSPPVSLLLKGNRYAVELRSYAKQVPRGIAFGSPSDDRGKLVCWRLRYVPDPTGVAAVTELYRNGKLVFGERGLPNMYEGDAHPYLKMGIYKWAWLDGPDTVTHRAISFGPVVLSKKAVRQRDDD